MGQLSTANYWGSSDIVRIPALGEYNLNPFGINIAECVLAAGSSDGGPAATSDTDANYLLDTQDCSIELFNVEGGSDSDNSPGVYVYSVIPVVVTLFTASVTMTIGDTDSAAGWFADAGFDVSATGQVIVTGSDDKDDDYFPYNNALGKFYPTSSGTIEAIVAGTTNIVAGRLHVYAMYFRSRFPSGF